MKFIALKIFRFSLFILEIMLFLAFLLLLYFNLPVGKRDEKINLGVTYSARYAEAINLDKKETLGAIFEDLGVKKIRIPVYWDRSEPRENVYDFSETDWQLEAAQKAGAGVILAIGQKVPRWPECFIPGWIGENREKRQKELLEFMNLTVNRYQNNPALAYWQVENEPFLKFGECPQFESGFLDQEIALVHQLDPNHKIIITDSGELSFWIPAAKRADVFGTTMYRSVFSGNLNLAFNYPIGPNFFKFKYWLIKKFARQNNIIIVELQGEPWLKGWTTDQPVDEQLESMDAKKLKDNVEFAKKTGFDTAYLWGAEWWYWMKVNKGNDKLWEAAKGMIRE
jgi:hypothetical protein